MVAFLHTPAGLLELTVAVVVNDGVVVRPAGVIDPKREAELSRYQTAGLIEAPGPLSAEDASTWGYSVTDAGRAELERVQASLDRLSL